jgi:hypothetical protein
LRNRRAGVERLDPQQAQRGVGGGAGATVRALATSDQDRKPR